MSVLRRASEIIEQSEIETATAANITSIAEPDPAVEQTKNRRKRKKTRKQSPIKAEPLQAEEKERDKTELKVAFASPKIEFVNYKVELNKTCVLIASTENGNLAQLQT